MPTATSAQQRDAFMLATSQALRPDVVATRRDDAVRSIASFERLVQAMQRTVVEAEHLHAELLEHGWIR
jgi:hypothetical protein